MGEDIGGNLLDACQPAHSGWIWCRTLFASLVYMMKNAMNIYGL